MKRGDLVRLKMDVPVPQKSYRNGTYGVVLGRMERFVYLVLLASEEVLCYDHELELVTEYDADC